MSAVNIKEVSKYYIFPMIRVSGDSKNRLAKAAGAEPCGEKHILKLKWKKR